MMCLSVVFFMIPVLGIHQASWICVFIVVVQSLSHVQLFVPPWTAAHRASLSFTVSPSLLKFMSLESVMLSNHLIICHPLLLLPSIFPSMGSFPMSQLFASGGQSIGASAISPSNEYSFRIDWFYILAVQETLKSLLQHHNSKVTIQRSAFFMVQLSHPHMTTGKNPSFDSLSS